VAVNRFNPTTETIEMPPQRRQLVPHRSGPFPISNIRRGHSGTEKQKRFQLNIDTGTKHPKQRLEEIITSIYAEMSKMQHQQYEAINMLRNCDGMLRKQATDKAKLEEENR